MLVCDYVCIYIYRKISFCFLLLLGIFEYIANEIFSSLISIVSNFHPMINLEDRVLNIYIYIGNFFENYAIQVFNSPGVTKRGIWSESMIDPCLSCSLYVIIKLSIFDISSSSDKFNDTRWIKVHGSVLDGASSFLLASNVSIFKLIGVRVTLRRFNETNSLIAVWCNIRSLTLISEFLRSCRIFRGGYVVVKSVTCLLSVP